MLMVAGCASEGELVVDLVTDLRPGVEIVSAVAEVYAGPQRGEVIGATAPRPMTADLDLVGGTRVGQLSGVPFGAHLVRVSLQDAAGEEVAEGLVVVSLDAPARAVTVRVTRDCLDVSCPGDGSPTAVACLGGACVEPTCSPETPETCPEPECAADADCPSDRCVVGRCEMGVCFARADDAQCSVGSCHPTRGCEGWSSLSVGENQACAILDGTAWCWGAQLGGVVSVPTQVEGLPSAVTQVSAGWAHACAIAEGRAFCWGSGEDGEHGDGAARSSRAAVEVSLSPPVAEISAGDGATCAIAGGGPFCWGQDSYGRIGNGPTLGETSEPGPLDMPAEDADLAVSVTASGDKGCVRLSDGRAYCWGHNDSSVSIGVGEIMQDVFQSPAEILATDVARLAVGGWHTCALSRAGAVSCWGDGRRGMLGDGQESNSGEPVTPIGLDDGVTALAVGTNTFELDATCAIRAGQVLCFGSGWGGRLGVGSTDNALEPVAHTSLPADAVDVGVGRAHACALLVDGSIHCWGRGNEGQLGDGTMTTSLEAVRVVAP